MNKLSKDSTLRQTIDENSVGQRIDNYLVRRLKGVPKSHIYRILRSGEVRVNSGRIGPDYRLQAEDQVRIPPVRTAQKTEPRMPAGPGFQPVVLFEDEALLAIDKPSGMAVHGGSGVSFGVIEALRHARPEAKFLELVHRLDRETSGVLLLAKKRTALVELHRQLQAGETEKRYLALVKQGLKRMFLHARMLAVRHPMSREKIVVEAPLPPELQQFIEASRRHA